MVGVGNWVGRGWERREGKMMGMGGEQNERGQKGESEGKRVAPIAIAINSCLACVYDGAAQKDPLRGSARTGPALARKGCQVMFQVVVHITFFIHAKIETIQSNEMIKYAV